MHICSRLRLSNCEESAVQVREHPGGNLEITKKKPKRINEMNKNESGLVVSKGNISCIIIQSLSV